MSFQTVYSADDLRYLSTKMKREAIVQFIEYNIVPDVLKAAAKEKTSYFWQAAPLKGGPVRTSPPTMEISDEDLVIALKQKFPGTVVEAQETWIEVTSGVKNLQKGIRIDWS